jgi:YVTN family beta-propeller protein
MNSSPEAGRPAQTLVPREIGLWFLSHLKIFSNNMIGKGRFLYGICLLLSISLRHFNVKTLKEVKDMYRIKFLFLFLVLSFLFSVNLALSQEQRVSQPASKSQSKVIDLKKVVFVASRESNELVALDTETYKVLWKTSVGASPHMAVISSKGLVYVTGTKGNEITVVNGYTGGVEGKIRTNAIGPEHAMLSPDEKRLFVANVEGNAVSVIDVESKKLIANIPALKPHNIVLTPDGRKAYIAQLGSFEILALNLREKLPQVVGQISSGSKIRLASLDMEKVHGVNNATYINGLLFAPNQGTGELAIIDTKNDRATNIIKIGREPWEPYATPDGRLVLVPNLTDETVSVIDTRKKEVIATLPGGRDMTGISITPDGKKAYLVRRGDNKLSVFDLKNLVLVKEITVGKNPEVSTMTADGRKVFVTNSGSNDISVIDTGADKVVSTIKGVGRFPWALSAFGGYNYCH